MQPVWLSPFLSLGHDWLSAPLILEPGWLSASFILQTGLQLPYFIWNVEWLQTLLLLPYFIQTMKWPDTAVRRTKKIRKTHTTVGLKVRSGASKVCWLWLRKLLPWFAILGLTTQSCPVLILTLTQNKLEYAVKILLHSTMSVL